jgi:hypothetical protein
MAGHCVVGAHWLSDPAALIEIAHDHALAFEHAGLYLAL